MGEEELIYWLPWSFLKLSNHGKISKITERLKFQRLLKEQTVNNKMKKQRKGKFKKSEI